MEKDEFRELLEKSGAVEVLRDYVQYLQRLEMNIPTELNGDREYLELLKRNLEKALVEYENRYPEEHEEIGSETS